MTSLPSRPTVVEAHTADVDSTIQVLTGVNGTATDEPFHAIP
ncbi:hypothetical protein ACVB8X_25115 [Streptomyces sp. NRAIS4]